VEAPAFMRGKERFSAPGNSLDSIMRFSAGNARAVLYRLYRLRKTRFVSYQGTTLVGPLRPIKDLGFNPCALSLLRTVFAQAFRAGMAEVPLIPSCRR
jgi:hypothetical protein